MKNKKKSQFYFLTAVIFISAAYLIFAGSSNISLNRVGDLSLFLENYAYEARIVMNNAIRNGGNVSYELREYTESFLSYASGKDINLGVLYLFSRDEKIYIVNYLNEPVLIKTLSQTLNPEAETAADFRDEVEIAYRNETYTYAFAGPQKAEFKTLFVKEDE